MAMLNAVVCALAGYPGEIFGGTENDGVAIWCERYEPGSPERCTIKLQDEHEEIWGRVMAYGERVAINELVKLGYHYREIARFATVSSQPDGLYSAAAGELAATTSGEEDRPRAKGAYERAFSLGILDVLRGYREHVLDLERSLKREDNLIPVTELQSRFCEYAILLPELHGVVCTVAEGGVHGCKLITFLEERAVCGIPSVERALRVVLSHVYKVLYKQLAAWLAYGMIVDGHGEFFIAATSEEANPDAAEASPPSDADASAQAEDERESTSEWHAGFEVRDAFVPIHISSGVAATILFVGKSQRLLSLAKSKGMGEGAGDGLGSVGILAHLDRLQSMPEFSRPAFERSMNAIRHSVASDLWHLVVVKADLPKHLQALKDYFLMERGNFHQLFLSDARLLMQRPPRQATAHVELSGLFHQAAQRTDAESDPLFRNVSVSLDLGRAAQAATTSREGGKGRRAGGVGGVGAAQKIHVPACDGWDGMALRYAVDWPLGLVLTPEVLSKYHAMFQYLWRLRRVHVELDEVWTTLRRLAVESNAHATLSNSPLLWHLRHQMVHLICNVQIYVQVDVIETQSKKLEQRVSSASDFMDLKSALDEFLDSLVAQSFLDIASISSMLEGIMKVCFQFCVTVNAQIDSETPLDSLPMFRRLQEDFARRCNMLFAVLKSTKLSVAKRAPKLQQLLLRVNFNEYVGRQIVLEAGGGSY